MKKWLVAAVMLLLLSAAANDTKKAEDQFNQAVKTADSLQDCVVTFQLYSSSGKGNYLSAFEDAKYIRSPALYYQRRTKVEASYKEQGSAGFQEIYRGGEDITELLMPGAFRALGLIKIYPEDPKGFGMNGGSLKSMAPWDMADWFARMAKIGKVTEEAVTRNNKQYLKLDVVQNPGTFYYAGSNHVCMYVDPQTLLPWRFEWYWPGQDKPASWIEYMDFKANTGLKPDQFAFEGFKSPFSLIKSPPPKEIDPYLKPVARTRLADPAPDVSTVLAAFNKAVDSVNNYRADLSMSFRYGRLRLFREDRFAYNKSPYWFVLVTTAQKADYILLNHSAGAVLWIDPSDKTIHIIGGGVQRILGEQIFSESDYKFYSPLEDNPYELDFPHLQAMLKESFTAKPEAWMVDYQGKKMWELKAERILTNLVRAPSKMNLIIDPATGLPAVVEFTGYDDPKAYMSMAVSNIKTNTDLKQGATKF